MKGERLVLSGDIGGTKTYLALFSLNDGVLEAVREGAYLNERYSGPEEVLRDFLRVGEARAIEGASFGIACPVVGNRCVLTNLNWTVDGAALQGALGLKRLALINDLEAIGWGVSLLPPQDFFVLQQGIARQGNAALIAAGTGLGEAILFWDGASHIPSASEGGHTDFGPRDSIETELLGFLIGRYGHVSYERIVSGMGLENIYEFVKARAAGEEPLWLKERISLEGVAPVVSEEGMKGSDKNCAEALRIFVSIYGAEAGNLALKALSTHGIYLGGGITPKILNALASGAFLSAFEDKGRFREFMKSLPVRVILNDRTGLIGAANYAARMLGESVRKVSLPGNR
jgi:glucokinase